MTAVSLRADLFALLIGVGLVAGCAPPPVEQKSASQPAAAVTAPPMRAPVSINAEMVTIVDHAAHQLWEVEREGNAPKTDAAWANLEEHATQMAAAGALVTLAPASTTSSGPDRPDGRNGRAQCPTPAWRA